MSRKRGHGLTALAVCGAVVGCGGWVDLERPNSGGVGSGGTGATTSGGSGGSKGLEPSGAGKPSGSGNQSGREGGEQPEGVSAGGAPSGDCSGKGTCFEALTAPAPKLVPAGADAAAVQGFVTVTAGDLQAGALVGYSEYCFKLSAKNQTCDFKSREPFVWTEEDGLMPLDRLQQLGGIWFYPDHVSADGRTVVGAFAPTSDAPGDSYRLFRWTKAEGGKLLGEPAEAVSQSIQFLSRDGAVAAGLFKLLDKGAKGVGHVAFVWSPSTGFKRLDEFQSWRPDSDLMAMSEDGSALIAQSNGDSREVLRFDVPVAAQPLGHLPALSRCTFAAASSDLTSVFGTCEDSLGSRSGFRWTSGQGMAALAPPSGTQSCAFNPNVVSRDGSVAFGVITCPGAEVQLARWSVDGGVVALPGFSGQLSALSASSDGAVAFGSASIAPEDSGTEPPPPGLPPVVPELRAFRWDSSAGLSELAALPGDPSATPLAADPHGGVIVGYSGEHDAQTSRAVLWSKQGVAEIAGLLKAGGILLDGVRLDTAERIATHEDRMLVEGQGSSGAWIARLPPRD